MNEPIKISSLVNYISQIDHITTDPEKGYLYRGQENEQWRFTSSAYRRLHRQYSLERPSNLLSSPVQMEEPSPMQKEDDLARLYDAFHRLWQRYLQKIVAEVKLKYPSTYRDLFPLECMAHLQHNNVATGLIDFTFSPLVALWFACANENIDGKVIVLENDAQKIKEVETTETLKSELEYFFDVDQEQWYLWSPSLDGQVVDTQRMTTQQSVFLFGLPEIEKEMIAQEIIVSADAKETIRTELAKMGISEKTLFSDLLGFFEKNSQEEPYDHELTDPTLEEHSHEENQ